MLHRGARVKLGIVEKKGAFGMSVSKQDREDYEEGRRDRERGVFDTAVTDISGNHPDTEAYYKGRNGEQLDEDAEDD